MKMRKMREKLGLTGSLTSSSLPRTWNITIKATLSRTVVCLLAYCTRLIVSDYDTSADLILLNQEKYLHSMNIIKPFLRWDAIYFVHIAVNGYIYEQEHAFSSLLPTVMNWLTRLLSLTFSDTVSNDFWSAMSGILLSNLCFILSAILLYWLIFELTKNESISYVSAILFCITPASIFMSSIYSESIFTLLSFLGMYLFTKDRQFIASISWGLASTARSNGLIYNGFFVYAIICEAIKEKKLSILNLIRGLVYISVTTSGFIFVQYHPYQLYCLHDQNTRPWCKSFFSYPFIQKHYWNNGFLSYYTLSNIPLFILASPMILLSISGIYSYMVSHGFNFHSDSWQYKSASYRPKIKSNLEPYFSPLLFPYIVLWIVLLIFVTTFAHVQIITRFFSSLPVLYCWTAHLIIYKNDNKFSTWSLIYFLLYSIISVCLFAAFYPPA